jgi:hypothetical protein
LRVAGAVAIVTGASSGIGEATALALARGGARVVGVARREEQLQRVVDECRTHAPDSVASPGDVSDRATCERIIADATERFGRVDILVNNAGVSMRRHVAEQTIDEVERVMRINYLGTVYLTLSVLPQMVERDEGCIVNVTSVAGYVPNPRESAYAASKAAISMFTHTAAVDLADSGVHVGVVSPGPIATEIWDKDEEEAAYEGKLYPPSVVADAIIDVIEHEKVHLTAPRHYGLVGALYPLLQRPMRRGLVRFQQKAESARGSMKRDLPPSV